MIIGIDPDAIKSGVCFYKGDRDFDLKSLSFFELVDVIRENPNWIYCLEDVERNKPVFARGVNAKAMAKIGQNVGQVKQTARLLKQAVEAYANTKPIMVRPGVGKPYKKNAELFNKASGWAGRSNEDTRDAWAIAVAGQTTCRLNISR